MKWRLWSGAWALASVALVQGCKESSSSGPSPKTHTPAEQGSSNDAVTEDLKKISQEVQLVGDPGVPAGATTATNAAGDDGAPVYATTNAPDPLVREGCDYQPRVRSNGDWKGQCQWTTFEARDKATNTLLSNRTFSLRIFNADQSRELYRANVKSNVEGLASTYYMDGFYGLPFKLCLNDEVPLTASGGAFVFQTYREPKSCHIGNMPAWVPYVPTRVYRDLFHEVRVPVTIEAEGTMSLNVIELISTGSYCPQDPIVITSDTYTVRFPFPYNLLGLLGFCRKLDSQFSIEVLAEVDGAPIENAAVQLTFGDTASPVFRMTYKSDAQGRVVTDRFSRVRGLPYQICVTEDTIVSKCTGGTTVTDVHYNDLTGPKAIKVLRNFSPLGDAEVVGPTDAEGAYGRDGIINGWAFDKDHNAPTPIRVTANGVSKVFATSTSSDAACAAAPDSCGKLNIGFQVRIQDLNLPVGGPYDVLVEAGNVSVPGQNQSEIPWAQLSADGLKVKIPEAAVYKKPSEVDAVFKMYGAPSSYNWGGGKEYWILTEVPNKFGVKYLFILPTGEMFEWNPADKGGFLATFPGTAINSTKIAELDPVFYKMVARVIAGIDDPNLPPPSMYELASELDAAVGMFGTPGSKNWGGGNEWWIQTAVTNEFGQKYVYLLPNGEVWAWSASDKAGFLSSGAAINSKLIGKLNPKYHTQTALLVSGVDFAEDVDRFHQFVGNANSRNWGGLDEWWFQGKAHEFGNFYCLLPNGHVYKWNPADTRATFRLLRNSVRIAVVPPEMHGTVQSLVNGYTP